MNKNLTVIVTCHNYGLYLRDCLKSLDQSILKPAEVVIVFDNCSDFSESVGTNYTWKSKSIKVKFAHINAANAFLARRAGFKQATSEFVCFVDADDMVDDDYFQTLMEKAGPSTIVTGEAWSFGSFGGGHWEPQPFPNGVRDPNTNQLLHHDVIPASIATRKAFIESRVFSNFNCAALNQEDWSMWAQVSKRNKIIKTDGHLFYRQHENNKSLSNRSPNHDTPRSLRGIQTVADLAEAEIVWVANEFDMKGGLAISMSSLAKYCKKLRWHLLYLQSSFSVPEAVCKAFDGRVETIHPSKNLTHEIDSRNFDFACLTRNHDLDYSKLKTKTIARLSTMDSEGLANRPHNKIIGISEACRDIVPKSKRRKMTIIPNGVDFSRFDFEASKTEARRRFNLEKKIAVGFCGRIHPEKRLSELLAVLDGMPENYVPVICSKSNNPSLREIHKNAVWLNHEQLTDFYRAINVLVIPSKSETGPNTALEAMVFGVPVVATKVGLLNDIQAMFGDEAFIEIQNNDKLEDVASAIRKALTMPCKNCSEDNVDLILNNFTAYRMASAWDALI